jgi:hypothetical protein
MPNNASRIAQRIARLAMNRKTHSPPTRAKILAMMAIVIMQEPGVRSQKPEVRRRKAEERKQKRE